MSILITLLYVLFVLSAIVLIVVVLLQEGKGGGLTDALGTHGQETFGAGARGINTFTGVTAAVFLGTAIFITVLHRQQSGGSLLDSAAPAVPSSTGTPPAAPAGGANPAPQAPTGG